jgi:SPX domain protein involved in polyphosphate accumulation
MKPDDLTKSAAIQAASLSLERYEAKYTIPLAMIEPISRFIAPYCSLDSFSARTVDQFYTINSLYFDTPAHLFLRQRLLKVEKRFNVRIRSYGDDPQPPYFLEIKQRRGDVIRKLRAKVNADNLRMVVEGYEPAQSADDNRRIFCRTVHDYNAHPIVLVQYRRKAYVSDCDDYARVTFDVGLRYAPCSEYDPRPSQREMIPCDTQSCFDSGCSVILELKSYTAYVPLWMIDLVRTFELYRRGFSKYANCVGPLLERYSGEGMFLRESVCAPWRVNA